MKRICRKCGYERQGNENVPIGECPGCGAIYAKVEAALEKEEEKIHPPARRNDYLPNWVVLLVLAAVGFAVWVFADPDLLGSYFVRTSNGEGSEVRVTEAEYGAKWPYTIPLGTLGCESAVVGGYTKKYVTLSYLGSTYAINGSANSSGRYRPLSSIWRDDPLNKGAKVPDPGIIQRGLALCE